MHITYLSCCCTFADSLRSRLQSYFLIMPSLERYLQAGMFTIMFLILYPMIRLFPRLFPDSCKRILIKQGFTPHDAGTVIRITRRHVPVWGIFNFMREGILYGQASVGKPAPNPLVVKMDGVTGANLLDFATVGRPLVLNFGSCTWTPFMRKLVEINRLYHEYGSVADFVTIYTQEAHATDGWGSEKTEYKIAYHRQMKDRIFAAQMLEKSVEGHLVVDTMSNAVCKLYRATPERLCIVMDGVVQYYGKQGPFGYYPEEVEKWLKDYSIKQK